MLFLPQNQRMPAHYWPVNKACVDHNSLTGPNNANSPQKKNKAAKAEPALVGQ